MESAHWDCFLEEKADELNFDSQIREVGSSVGHEFDHIGHDLETQG